ncbi:MAG TPA: Stk1 family PASTA domain-containing Ser/Thr kinase, partial [Citricoccus sp.]
GRKVAIKMMRPDLARDPQFQSRFRREARSSAALNHPNIVAVFDTGEETYEDGAHHGVDCPFMVMEFVDGRTLREVLRREEVTVDQAVQWTSSVLAALDFSHAEGIVHRDIKPANVMVTTSGAVKVMDFGIARALSDSAATMTQTQAVVGTAQYLSPEQARGETVDSRSDLYSAGCLLFELLTGRAPFVGDSPVAVAYQHVRETPPAPSSLNPEVSRALDAVMSRALAKDRVERFQSGAEFRRALERALRHPDDAGAAGVDGPAHPGATGAAAAGATVSGGGSTAAEAGPTEAIDLVPGEVTEAIAAVGPRSANPTLAMAAVGSPAAVPGVTGTDRAPSAVTPPAPVPDDDTGHPLAFADRPPGHTPPRRRRRRVWIPVLVVVLALAAVAGGWFLMDELNRRNLEANQVTVPEVAEMTQMEAQNTLTSAELRPILEEVYDDEIGRDLAVGTEPEAGATVQKNQEVTLLISIGPEQLTIPEDLAGASEATTRDTLEELGLSISSVRYVPSAGIPRDRLVETSPELGSTVRAGSSVELLISSGMVQVPDLSGMTRDEARQALEDLGLSMDVETVERSDVPAGTVLGQEQSAGTEVPQGSPVGVQVAAEPRPSPTPTPSPTEDSESPSPSASASESPSESESASPSPSESDSASPSPSESESAEAAGRPEWWREDDDRGDDRGHDRGDGRGRGSGDGPGEGRDDG